MRLARILTLALLVAAGRTAVAQEEAEWKIEIAPREAVEVAETYDVVYEQIPFSRAEWLANPSYRHDAAMAILTGSPVQGRTPPVAELQRYADPRPYRNTFFPRLSPTDLHYKYTYGWLWYRPYGTGTGWFR